MDSTHRRQGPFCIWHGLEIGTWLRLLRLKPPIAPSHWPAILGISAASCSNSVLALLEKLIYARKLRETNVPPPVFIIGHWRSGTTLLHNLLSLDPQFVTPSLYQTVFPGHFLVSQRVLAPLTARFLPAKRPMDEIPVTGWDMPQEDEIAICLLSLISPYLMLAFPDHRAVYEPFLDLREISPSVQKRWDETFVGFLKKVVLHENGRRPLLKSPTHSYRIPLLLKLFPDAKFVHIVRNPYRVIMSSLHLRRVTFSDNAFYRPSFAKIEEDVFALYERCFERLEEDLPILGSDQLHEVRLEDLEADIPGELSRMYAALKLPGYPDLEREVSSRLPALQNFKKNDFHLSEDLQGQIERRCRRVFDRYGYPLRDKGPAVRGASPEQVAIANG